MALSTELLMRLGEKSTKVETKRFLADGDVVMVLPEVTVGAVTAPEADVFEFRDGKVVKAHSVGDTAMQERVWRSKRVAAGQLVANCTLARGRCRRGRRSDRGGTRSLSRQGSRPSMNYRAWLR